MTKRQMIRITIHNQDTGLEIRKYAATQAEANSRVIELEARYPEAEIITEEVEG
jgi:hypothetical protein